MIVKRPHSPNRPSLWMLIILCGGLLMACGPSSDLPDATLPTEPAAVLPSSIPATTVDASATPFPTTQAAATATPAPPSPTAIIPPTASSSSAALPSPVYFLEGGQIWRLEADGNTRRQVSFDSQPVLSFSLAPATNTLVYLAGTYESARIVALDASGYTELFQGMVSAPEVSPDGSRIAFRVEQPIDGLSADRDGESVTGIYLQERHGGAPTQIIADDPPPSESNTAPELFSYDPISWSPDGTRLLVWRQSYFEPLGLLGIWSEGQGLVPIPDACCQGTWSPDSSTIVIPGGVYWEETFGKLWQADASTGTPRVLREGIYLTNALVEADGSILAFFADDSPQSLTAPVSLTIKRFAPDGTITPLRLEAYDMHGGWWAPDGSGAIITPYINNANGVLEKGLWLASDGSPARELPIRTLSVQWGNQQATMLGACEYFVPLASESEESREVNEAVRDLQGRLAAAGFHPGAIDGLFGDQTMNALAAFQAANQLEETGELNCLTWQVLFAQ